MGLFLEAQNKFKQAEKAYRKGLEIYPDNPSLLANYGATLAVLGKIDKAKPVLRAAIRQLPNNPSTYNSLAQVFLRQKKPEKAREMLVLAVTVNPNFANGACKLGNVVCYDEPTKPSKVPFGKSS